MQILYVNHAWRKCPETGCSGGVQWCSGVSRVSIFSKLDTLDILLKRLAFGQFLLGPFNGEGFAVVGVFFFKSHFQQAVYPAFYG
jgi:hypothetical protein